MECEFESCERSGEEDAELQRSTKKVKEDFHPGSSQTSLESDMDASNTMSFKAKLVGDVPGAFAQAFKLHANEDEEPFSDEEVDDPPEGTVAIKLSKWTKMNIRAKWTHSLIVKVFGRKVGFHFLHSRIMQLWKPTGRLDCIDLENDFYLCKFGLVEDFEKVLKGPGSLENSTLLSVHRSHTLNPLWPYAPRWLFGLTCRDSPLSSMNWRCLRR